MNCRDEGQLLQLSSTPGLAAEQSPCYSLSKSDIKLADYL